MNKALLKSKMALNNDNNKTLAKKMGLTQATFSNKLNSKNNFTIKEMNLIRKIYNLSEIEFVSIFF